MRYPEVDWDTVAAPDAIGWSGDRLRRVEEYARAIGSRALFLASGGGALLSWGEVSRPFAVRSIRKSLLSCLYGIHIAEGHITLSRSLDDLEIDDTEPALTPLEKQATIADLLTSRSGVYHPSNCATAASRAMRPPRESHSPGTHWYYNNWDFNALGTIFEQCTGTRIFDEFERRVARPLHMQDYCAGGMCYLNGPDSIHPSYSFRVSARDLARFGLLYLRHGLWGDRQVVPSAWVTESTTAHIMSRAGPGFGYMWWVCVDGRLFFTLPMPEGAYASYGVGAQFLVVIPSLDVVVVHLCDPDAPGAPTPSRDARCQLLQLILDAHQP